MNLILSTDSYKMTHWKQYPPHTETVYSYFESRLGAQWNETVFFGLQHILQRLAGKAVTMADVEEAAALAEVHLGPGIFNIEGWTYIAKDLGGRLPLRIKAVPEGTVVNVSNVMMTVENTDPKCFWLTNYVESLLTHVWYPSTVATLSWQVKQMMKGYLDKTSDNPDAINFMLHDFGYRGVSSEESAEIGGAAHLVNFMGTDTIPAMALLLRSYGADLASLAFSVPATEHSVMTARGQEGEYDVLDQLIEEYPTGILSVVADSYDIYAFTDAVIARKDKILARDGRFVERPDSVTPEHPYPSTLTLEIVSRLWEGFGGETNSKGYKVLNDKIRALWGDGIDPVGIEEIILALVNAHFSAENLVFGMGGGLLQKVNRDTQRFAFKSSAQERDGVWYDIAKNPLDRSKRSKTGRLRLVKDEFKYRTIKDDDDPSNRDWVGDELVDYFLDGEVLQHQTLDEIRQRSNESWIKP